MMGPAMASVSTPLEHSEDMRAFLQRRVAWAGLIGAGLGGFFLVFRAVMSLVVGKLSLEVAQPSFLNLYSTVIGHARPISNGRHT